MKNLICLTIVVSILAGCAPRYSLKGSYQEAPYVIPIPATKSTNDMWAHLMDFLSQENITPRFVKRKKCIIITNTVSFKELYTKEDTLGRLLDTTKYVVLPYVKTGMYLEKVTGYWTIKMHEHKKKSVLTIELSKVTSVYDSENKTTKLVGNKVSTGVFEKKLQQFVQKQQ